MTENITPLPWTYRFRSDGTSIETLDGDRIATNIRTAPKLGQIDANAAAYIVKAANAYPVLLAALEFFTEGMSNDEVDDMPKFLEEMSDLANAALRTARGE